jgi:hypothetical protein
VKKYVDKRWAATSNVPVIPPGKRYRKQETQVIDFVSSGELDLRLNKEGPAVIAAKNPQIFMLKLLKKGDQLEIMAPRKPLEGSIDHVPEQIISKQILKPFGNSTATSTSNVSCKDLLLDEIDMNIPKAFNYTVMSPRIFPGTTTNSDSPLASSNVSSYAETDPDFDLIVTVCDAWSQTEREF